MKILAFDTSTPNFSLALSKDGFSSERNALLGNLLSEQIIPHIESFLQEQKTAIKELDGFCVGIGPGSFTGLRIGLAVAKGFAFALRKPLIGISSLDILAMNAFDYGEKICCLVDAKREKLYAAIYRKAKGKLNRETPYLLTDIDNLLKKISKESWFIGNGIDIYRDKIVKRLGKRANFALSSQWFPRAGKLAKLAQSRFQSRKFDDLIKLVPIYLYPQECQVKSVKR